LLYLLKMLGEDVTYMFNIATIAPETIAEGTAVYGIDGTTFHAPATLYKICSMDFDKVLAPDIYDFGLDDIFPTTPMVVYTDIPPYELIPTDLPTEFQTKAQDAIDDNQQTFSPAADDYGEALIPIASKRTNTPIWSNIYFEYLEVFDGCDYSEVPAHIVNNLDATWTPQHTVGGELYWHHDGHAYTITSCNSTYHGQDLVYEYSSPIGSLSIYGWIPSVPSFWFAPEFVAQQPDMPVPIGGFGGTILAMELLSICCPALGDRIKGSVFF
jgi:hypothetical protein